MAGMNAKSGFSLAEIMLSMMIISILIAISIPAITKLRASSGFDVNSRNCIITDNADNSTSSCKAAIDNCKYNRSGSCSTIAYFIDKNIGATQTAALKLAKYACDQGGFNACDIFLNRCLGSGVCDDGSNYDLESYLNMASNDSNVGRAYIQDKGNLFYHVNQLVNIKTAVDAKCGSCPGTDITACKIKCPATSSASSDPAYEVAITNCNNGNATACTQAYNNNWNRSCKDIANIWTNSLGLNNRVNDTYKLTYDAGGGTIGSYNAFCDIANGGWTLVMKIKGSSGNFVYNSNNWTTCNQSLNPQYADETTVEDHINYSYCNIPITYGAKFTGGGMSYIYLTTSTSLNTLVITTAPSTTIGLATYQKLFATSDACSNSSGTGNPEGFTKGSFRFGYGTLSGFGYNGATSLRCDSGKTPAIGYIYVK